MGKAKQEPMTMTSDQLYKLAGLARAGKPGNARLLPPDEDGTVMLAVKPTKPSPSDSANGWRYTAVTAEGIIKPVRKE